MSDPVLIALIVGGSSAIPSIVSMIIQFFMHGRMTELERNTNGIQAKLNRTINDEAFARGLKTGTDAAIGPPGPTGEQGPQGERGEKGKLF